MRNKTIPFLLLSVATILFIADQTNAQFRYRIIDLGTLPDHVKSYAYSINDSNQIVGCSYPVSGSSCAVLFDPNADGNYISLQGSASWAYAINNKGQIVGTARHSDTDWSAPTLFDSTGGGANINLGYLGCTSYRQCQGEALSINDTGQIVGWSETELELTHATLFDPTGNKKNKDLGTLPGHNESWARYINNLGQAVGWSRNTVQQGTRAVLFDLSGNSNNIDLGTLGGPYSDAMAINNRGQVVGFARPASGGATAFHACLFDPNGSGNNIDLGTLAPSDLWSIAYSINDSGAIVGRTTNRFDEARATLFDPSGQGNNIDLNMLIEPYSGWRLLQVASCINNNGSIVGWGFNPDGIVHAFLLIPPEQYCGKQIPGDGNGDCKIDFTDFEILASHWLDCNLVPQTDCWE